MTQQGGEQLAFEEPVAPAADGRYLCQVLDREFTEAQLAVATGELAPQLVVAGAGSGKTTVMAARVVHAVAWHGVPPAQVLGLTFTNKAAGQLAEQVRVALRRLRRHVPAPRVDHEAADVDDTPTVSTYHSYAAAIVRDHALRVGREPVTTLMSEAGRWQLATRVVRRAAGPFPSLSWQPPTVAAHVLALDGELAEHRATVADVRAYDASLTARLAALPSLTNDLRACADAAAAREELLDLVEVYRDEKRRLDLLDFGDQVALAAEIVERAPEVARLERHKFRLVLLDEYQDTGVAQRLLLSGLYAGHAVTAVGDPHQAIYGWRGASVGNLLRFHSHFGADGGGGEPEPLALMTSFRCGGRILDVANAVSEPLRVDPPPHRPPLRVPSLSAAPGREVDGRVVVSLHEKADGESAWVAEQVVATLVASPELSPRDVAVLCRRRSDFPMLHRALVERGLPVEVVGLGGLLEMPEVADVVAVLRVVADPTANAALLRLLTGPRWRIGPRDLAALGRRARLLAAVGPAPAEEDPAGVDAALRAATQTADPVDLPALTDAIDLLRADDATDLSAEAVQRLLALRAELDELRHGWGQPIVEVAAEVVRRTGLDVELEVEPSRVAAARIGNLAAFLDHAAAYVGIEGETDLTSFLGWLDAAAAAENGLDVGGVSDADTVKLLTVHKAKGLEWQVVAVPGLCQSIFPSSRGRSRWTGHGAVLPFPCRGDSEDLPSEPSMDNAGLKAFATACRGDDADEERRLAYVAVTRARSLLLASGYWWGRTQRKPLGPSSLLLELRGLSEVGLVDVDGWCEPPVITENPLAAEAAVDVEWPVVPDETGLRVRREAVGRVRDAAAAALTPPEPAAALTDPDRALVAGWDAELALLLDEARRSREAGRDVPLPRRLSASQVVMLAQDPARLAQSLARPLPSRPAPQARRGSRFHRWVEQLHGASALIDPEDLPGASDADVDDDELAALQQAFRDSGWAQRRPVAVEAPFELAVGGRLLRGRIDAVYRDDEQGADGDGFDVVDYKTGGVPRDVAAAAVQLSVYRLAWAGLAGVDPDAVRAGFLYVRTGRLLRPERLLDLAELAALLDG